ncbi:MAG: YceH family protein [Halothiobacillaceae bacterium]
MPDDIQPEGQPMHDAQSREAPSTDQPMLTPVEARVLGCLMEKQRTTPDAYPLTLNALVTACNQKSARNPVLNLTLGEVGHAVNALRDRGLVSSQFSGRTERYEQLLDKRQELTRQMQALLCLLMLRGPLTVGELRSHAGRMAEFENLEEVAYRLERLAQRTPPLVTRLPRAPGKREERYAHLLCGAPAIDPEPEPASRVADAPGRMAELEARVEHLENQLEQLWTLTGLADQRPEPKAGSAPPGTGQPD